MFKKSILNLLLIGTLLGHTPQTKPVSPGIYIPVGLILGATFAAGAATTLVCGACGYGLYVWIGTPLKNSLSLIKEIEQLNKFFELSKANNINGFTLALKEQKIKNKHKLKKFSNKLKKYSKQLEKYSSSLSESLIKKERKNKVLGVHDIKMVLAENKLAVQKLNDLENFVEKNQAVILNNLIYSVSLKSS